MSKNQKLSYTAATITILDFDLTDVITTSGAAGDDGWGGGGSYIDPSGWT